jgi:predicted nucleic acid-binding Zn finger protein
VGALAVEQVYRYPHPSQLDGAGRTLHLATCSQDAREHPHFFTGKLTQPERTAKLLLSLMAVVQARFHIPSAMRERLGLASDPVVTSSDDRLRFEGFSACCGAYARVDLHPQALSGERFGRGTTNVDFNQRMLSALATVRGSDPVALAVGSDGVTLETLEGDVVEKKVNLPFRWLKGFVEVQAAAQRMHLVLEASGPEAVRFLRGLPRMKTNRRATWIVPAGRGLRITQVQPRGDAVRVGGLERLRAIERLAGQARMLRVFTDETTGATGWVLVFDDCRFHLLLSPEVWRGFSGEGQALESLAGGDWQSALRRVQAQLNWHAVIEPADLAHRAGVGTDVARKALAALGARGLVGFDLDTGAYFHRVLPFDLSEVERMQPRLMNARKLVADGSVRLEQRSVDSTVAFVASGDVEHRVRLTADQAKCTCPWYAKHQRDRGPCKHVLAVRIVLEDEDVKE